MPDLDTSLSYCTYCPKLCRHTCPVGAADPRETVTPRDKMATLRRLRAGAVGSGIGGDRLGDARGEERNAVEGVEGGGDEALLAETRESATAVYACTGCLACTTACHHGITPGIHLLEGRATVEKRDLGHAALDGLAERVRAKGQRAVAEARAVVDGQRVKADARVAFLPGCDDPTAAAPTFALLDRLGEPEVALAAVTVGCGGYPLLAGGFPDEFRLHAEAFAREVEGHERLVVACPACAWAMRTEYPKHGVRLRPEVVHTVEHLAPRTDELRITDGSDGGAPGGGEAFYHDPCYLGRHRGIYDEPRRLLARAVTVREFSRSRAAAECSGGGGVLPATMPATAESIAARRLSEVKEAGVRTVVTACPTCKRQLNRDGVRARDVVDVLEERTR